MADLQQPQNTRSLLCIGVGAVLLGAIGLLDAWLGRAVGLMPFYLLPIALLTWCVGQRAGLAMCVAATATWFLADMAGDAQTAVPTLARLWNGGMHLGVYVAVCLLLPAVKELQREQELARVDPLTGTANRRRLCEAVQLELMRSRRYARPMTVAFVDLDGFKSVNDRFGHAMGDRLLCEVVATMVRMVRRTDLLARIGGDEFVLLLPEIDQEAAKVIMPKLQSALDVQMQQRDWSVTFSIGVLTWRGGNVDAEELIRIADRLMYDIKRNGKNAIAYAVHAPAAQTQADGEHNTAVLAGS
jgi:diguanylate cyclase (GGDEF)-like protein